MTTQRGREWRRVTFVPPLLTPLVLLPYLGVLLTRLASIVDALTWNSDYSSPMVIAQTVAAGKQGGRVFVNQVAYMWFDVGTSWMPMQRAVWEWGPLVIALLIGAVLAWTAWRFAGAAAAALAVVLAIAVSPLVLEAEVAQALHGFAWLSCALLGVALANCCVDARAGTVRPLVPAIAAVVAGVNLASDPLVAAGGLVPLVIAAGFLYMRRARVPWARRAASASGLAAGATTVVAVVVAVAQRARGFSASFPAGLLHIADANILRANLRLLVLAAGRLAGGTMAAAPHPEPLQVAAASVLAILVVAAGVLALRNVETTPADAYAIFWTVAALVVTAGFLLTRAPAELGSDSSRYLVVWAYAWSAVVPLWVRSRVLVVPICVLCAALAVANAVSVERDVASDAMRQGNTRQLPRLISALRERGLDRGYASYRDSPGLTWKSEGAIHVYPVTEQPLGPAERCAPDSTAQLCPFTLNSAAGWFVPRRGERTFLLVDPGVAYVDAPPPASLGAPVETFKVGRFLVLVYGDDIATRMSLPPKFRR